MPGKPAFDEVDLSSMAFWSTTAVERDRSFAILRSERRVSWHRAPENPLLPADAAGGYWAVVRHADVVAVSKDPQTYCSGRGVLFGDAPPELLEASQSFLAMDSPRHAKLRRLVASAFTPRRVATIDAQIRAQARRIVDDLVERGDCDAVEHVSRRLPMWTISEMMGVASGDSDHFAHMANRMVAAADPEVIADSDPLTVIVECLMGLTQMALELAAARRAAPADDLMTALVEAEIDGDRLTDPEIGAFFVLLAVAGNDTTRNTISHTLRALSDEPDQRRLLREDFPARIDRAVEEMVRWATPVMTFRRTATRDVELHGVPIAEGDKVVLFYPSANRDETVFDEPWRFDIGRDPNPHVGFGGGGPHFCLGFFLARTQLRSIFDELLRRLPDLEVGEPEYIPGSFIHGVKRLPCRVGAVASDREAGRGWSGRLGVRDGELELGAAALGETGGHLAAVTVGDGADDEEPEPGAGDPPVALRGGAEVLVEEAVGVARGEPRTVVADGDPHRADVAPGVDLDAPALGRVLHRVLDEVGERDHEPLVVAADPQPLLELDHRLDGAELDLGRHLLEGGADEC